jgi:phosphoglycerol geranylgeranyltransferase
MHFGTKKSIIVLIDPDKVEQKDLNKLLQFDHIPFCWLVGGSILFENKFESTIEYLKQNSSKPVYIFPGNNLQVSKKADGILFLSLLSGRNPEYLIGQQLIAAPKVKAAQIASIPTGYILIDGGKETAVSYISNTKPIPRDKPEIALATCMAAELLGKKLLYIEAGSGADQSIPPSTIQMIKKHVDLPIIVGGGVKSVKVVQELLDAGADHVVIGNHIEENPEFMAQLSDLFIELNLVKD